MTVPADHLLLLCTQDVALRDAMAILAREQGWTLCTPETRGEGVPDCALTDLDGGFDAPPEGEEGDFPGYTLSFFEEKHPTLLRPFSEERLASLLRAAREGGGRMGESGEEKESDGPEADGQLFFRGSFLFDGRELFLAGKKIPLSKIEMKIFTLLYEAEGRPVSVETIAQAVWGRTDAVNNVRVYIRYLRQKLAAVSGFGDRNYIKTVRNGGFYLRTDWER